MSVRAKSAVACASVLLPALGTTSAHSLPADDPSPQELFEKAAPALVHILGEAGGIGTGFVYNADEGLILTNAHVVDGESVLKAADTVTAIGCPQSFVDDPVSGEVVGNNTLGHTEVEGQSCSITSDHARSLLDGLGAGDMKNSPGWAVDSLENPALSDHFQEQDVQFSVADTQERLLRQDVQGLFVLDTASNSPADHANLTLGDVITSIKDTPVTTVSEMCDVLQSSAGGETVRIEGVYAYDDPEQPGGQSGGTWVTDLQLPGP